jgi:cell pole-organizing protein PopZ
MEEILASIRRIIAEDGDAPPAADDKAAGRHDEILELTEVVEEDGTVVSLTPGGKKPILEPVPSVPPPAPAAAPPPIKRAAPEPAFETKPVATPEPVPPPPPRADRLVSGAAAAASIASMSQLAPARPGPIGSMALGDAGRTLEDLVRELLRPMLKDWLDAQLPKIVERLVQEEIQRMSREAQGR